jgi:pilus assembly protein CpaD
MSSHHHAQPGRTAAVVQAGRLTLLALLGALCAACSFTAKQEMTERAPTDYRLRHPITIKEAERTLEVFVGNSRGGLNPAQQTEIAGFASAWRREATGGIIIDVPSGTANAHAARGASSEIRSLLAHAGVPPQAVAIRGYRPSDLSALATIKLNYPRMAAQAGPCGLWPDDLGPTLDPQYNHNRPYWNLGCASQRNLAAQVANPADLVQPRAETPVYAARRSTVLDKYRQGEATATTYPDAGKGAISDVGK